MTLKIRIGDWEGCNKFILTDKITENAILGMDFLGQYNWYKNTNCIQILDAQDKIICELEKDIEVPPNTEMVLLAKANKAFSNKTIIFEPFDHSSQGIIAAKSISQVDESSIFPIQVFNYGTKSIKLKKSQLFGMIELPKCTNNVKENKANELRENNKLLFDHLMATIDMGSQLTATQKEQLVNLLVKYKETLSLSKSDLGECNVLTHKIDTSNCAPIKQPLYKTTLDQKFEIEKHVQDMYNNNIIEPSESPWHNNPVLVEKKNGEKRFCIDFRLLNRATLKDAYALPRIDEIVDAIGKAKLFTTLDLASGFWQILLDESSKEKTAFSSILGLMQFRVMPFGLCNAPATFQRLIEKVLTGLNWKQCVAYLDDTVVHSKNFEEQLIRLEQILIRFKEANLKIRVDKCKFAKEEVEFLGFKITKNGLLPCETKVEAIKKMQPPSNKKGVRSLIGFINHYRIFMKHLAHVSDPLYRLTRKNVKFEWTKECQDAFEQIKNLLITAPLLVYPERDKDFIIECDASNTALGAALSQDPTRPIAFASRQLTPTERRYSTSVRELLAIVWAAKVFKSYIANRHVTFFTDHKPLASLKAIKEPDGKIAQLLFKIQHLNYDIKYKPGKNNTAADFLSRISMEESSPIKPSPVKPMQPNNPIKLTPTTRYKRSVEEMFSHFDSSPKTKVKCKHFKILNKYDYRLEQSKDTNISTIIEEMSNPNSKFNYRQFTLINNVLYKISYNPKKTNKRIVAPKHLQQEIMEELHNAPTSGHLGRNKTLNRINRRYFWDNMKQDIYNYIDSCTKCQLIKRKPPKRAHLQHPSTNRPFQLLGIDVAGPLTTTDEGNKYIISAICYFSKYCVTKAIKDFTAFTTAKFIFEEIICKYGMPSEILTDQGSNFEAELTKNLCLFLNVKKMRTTSYHAKANGEVERFNKTLKTMLASYVSSHHRDWDLYLQQVTFAYNTSKQESTRLSPFRVIFGHDEQRLLDLHANYQHEKQLTPNSYVDLLIKSQQEINQIIKRNIEKSHSRQDKNYKVKNKIEYKINDLVLLNNEVMKIGQTKKFVEKYTGPFQIISIRQNDYKIKNIANNKTQFIHYDRLQPYKANNQQHNEQSVESKNTIPPLMSINLPKYNLRSNKKKP